MTPDVISTSKSIGDSSVDVAGVAAVDVFVTLDWVDSSCLFSDTTLEWILGMATVYVAVVEGLNSSGFLGFEFLYIISTPRCVFRCNSSLSSFAFNKKATKCEWLLLLEGSGIKRVVFMWGSSFYVEKGLVG